jgi:uncharacterized damage-inducible protein DinB
MISGIDEFIYHWSQEVEATQKVFKHLTDRSLSQAIAPEHRTLGGIAWHIVVTMGEMMSKTGLHLAAPGPNDPVPTSAKTIFKAYNDAALSLLEQVKSTWTNATLQVEDDMYGETWKRGATLTSLIFHQIHHRGQMTVLMRQAGLSVPGVYGPSRDEWSMLGVAPPAV